MNLEPRPGGHITHSLTLGLLQNPDEVFDITTKGGINSWSK